jgi:hypothetical protein
MTVSTTSEGPYDRIYNTLYSQQHATTSYNTLRQATTHYDKLQHATTSRCSSLVECSSSSLS